MADRPTSSTPPLRGRRGRDRRIAEQVAHDFATRHRTTPDKRGADEPAGDFDVDAVDREVEDTRRELVRTTRTSPPTSGTAPGFGAPDPRTGAGHRSPDLSALPPLLATTGTFASLLERLGSPADIGRVGRHAGLVAIPHGAKSYLAAALAIGERVVWVARDAEIGDRVADELRAWLGRPGSVTVLEPRTALAYERSELVADETAARVAALAAWRHGHATVLVASVQALFQHTISPDDLLSTPRTLSVGARIHQADLLGELLELGYEPVAEVAGRGEFVRRGGIVDVFPPSRELPIRIEFFGDEIETLRAFDPTDQRTTEAVDRAVLLPASEYLRPSASGGTAVIRGRLGRLAGRLGERLQADLERFEDQADGRTDAGQSESRALAVGDAAEVWAPFLAPSTGFDHIDPGTLLILDEPGDIV
jgi:hypothetical protein